MMARPYFYWLNLKYLLENLLDNPSQAVWCSWDKNFRHKKRFHCKSIFIIKLFDGLMYTYKVGSSTYRGDFEIKVASHRKAS